jgi:hypothetical protein
MKISKLIENLRRQQFLVGDVEVTCTGSLLPDGNNGLADVFETTVENIKVVENDETFGTHLRLYL